jgi:copper chaperone
MLAIIVAATTVGAWFFHKRQVFCIISFMKYQFKTNIQCNGCVQAVTPYLDANNEIKHWEVDINNPNKVLTVETDHLSGEMIRNIVKIAGYSAEQLNQ